MSHLQIPASLLSKKKKVGKGSMEMDKLIQSMMKEKEEYEKQLDNTPEIGSPKSKYYPYRKAKLLQYQNLIFVFNQLKTSQKLSSE